MLDMRKRKGLVCGVGINDYQGDVVEDGKAILSYNTWYNILSRCYVNSSKNPSYSGCSICDEWKHFSNFKQWYDENYISGYHLDKDIIVKSNKIYSPDACRFIPPHINTLLTQKRSNKGECPTGVNRHCGKFQAHLNKNGKRRTLGTFDTAQEAEAEYIRQKESYVREVAIDAFINNEILSDVASALINYKITLQ